MLWGLVILFICLGFGEGISAGLGLPIPGNVIGMVLLTLGLQLKIIRLEYVKAVADALIKNIAVLFVPPGVGLILYLEVIREAWLPILVGNFFSTLAVLAVVGIIQQRWGKS